MKIYSTQGFTMDVAVGVTDIEYERIATGARRVAKYVRSVAFVRNPSPLSKRVSAVQSSLHEIPSLDSPIESKRFHRSKNILVLDRVGCNLVTPIHLPCFLPIVRFLRLLLRKHGLDTVYTGGLNSWRVYALVICFLTRKKFSKNVTLTWTEDEKKKQSETLYDALLSFLEYHGGNEGIGGMERPSELELDCPGLYLYFSFPLCVCAVWCLILLLLFLSVSFSLTFQQQKNKNIQYIPLRPLSSFSFFLPPSFFFLLFPPPPPPLCLDCSFFLLDAL